MLKKITVILGLLVGSILAAQSQTDPSSSLSHLPSGTSISGSDLFYDVQVPGVGGVKVTGSQFLSFVFGNVSGNCSSSNAGVFSCTGGNATGIAAGTNITTSGSGVNVTVNTTLTPTFTSISTTLASVTGWLTAAGVNAQTETVAGALIGSTANFSGNLTGTTGNFTSNLTSTTLQVPGFLTASGGSFQTATIAGNLTGGSASFTTSLTAGNVQVSGFLTASGANFTSATIFGISGSTQCVQANSIGLLSGTSSPCSAPTVSIAAGNNISTNGTATNITVQVIPNPTFTSLTSTIAAFPSWITVGGANILTANIANNLTAQIAQFPGFLTASGANLNTATIVGLGGTTQCVESIAGVLTGTGSTCGTGQFSINAGTNIATSGTANNITVNTTLTPTFTSLTSTNGSITTLTGGTATFQTVTVNSLTPTGPNCLQETGGVIQSTNAACSGAASTPGGANTQVQFNNNNAFDGNAGFTFTTPAAVVITSGIVTTNNRALSIFQTWNSSGRTFDAPLFINVTDSASAAASLLADFQVGGTSEFTFRKDGTMFIQGASQLIINTLFNTGVSPWLASSTVDGTTNSAGTSANLGVAGRMAIGTSNGTNVILREEGVGLLGLEDATTATSFRIYNTTDVVSTGVSPTNYERGIADWNATANSFTVGTQAGGTGVGRNMIFIASGTTAQIVSSTATTFSAAINAPAIAQLAANTTGYACWTTGTGAISEDSTTCLASLRELKKDIVPFTDATRELMALKPSQFQWKNPVDANQHGPQLGFIAEDVYDVDRKMASFTGDGHLHGWRQDAMISALVRGFQEQQVIISRQQAEIDELKQRIH